MNGGIARAAIAGSAGRVCCALTLVLGVGCAGTPNGGKAATARARPTVAQASGPAADVAPGASAERDAQRAWCNYLEALYRRASGASAKWASFDECTAVTSSASPGMLKRAADCSLAALERFKGDPFTQEYASQVSQCGREAIDAMAVSQAEVAPYVGVICERATACGHMSYDECRSGIDEGLGSVLSRALGAMNGKSRDELRACLKTASCEDLGEQISGCITPIMDRLLWLPS